MNIFIIENIRDEFLSAINFIRDEFLSANKNIRE
jgi:hypothetical protein